MTSKTIVLLSMLLCSTGFSQVHTSLRHVNACLPVEGGHTLVATAGGVLLLDEHGRQRGVWTVRSGLPATKSNVIVPVAGRANHYWIGTEGGLVRVAWSENNLTVRETLRSAPVRAILQEGPTLWVATWGAGLLRRHGSDSKLELVTRGDQTLPVGWNRMTDLVRRGSTLIIASAGAGLLTLRNDRVVALPVAVPNPMIWSLAVTSDETLWVGTLGGLIRLRNGLTTAVCNDDVRRIEAQDDTVLVATYGRGLRRLTRSGATWHLHDVPPTLDPERRFVSALRTSGQHACLGTPDGLWQRASTHSPWVGQSLPGPPSNDIAAMAWDGERLWVGTFDQGLAVYERHRWRDVQAAGLSGRINALSVEKTDEGPRVWVGTARGLFAIHDGKTRRYSRADGLPSEDIHALTTRRRGGVIAGTSRGAILVRGDQVSRIGPKQGLKVRVVWAVAEAANGTLWLGSNLGLYRQTPDGQWRRFSVASGHLTDDWVTALRVHRNRVWVGSYAGGITELETEENDTVLASHLGGGFINLAGLTLWKGHLLAATMDGLLIRKAGKAHWTRHRKPGVGQDVTATLSSPMGIWVAGRRGLSLFPGRAVVRSRSLSTAMSPANTSSHDLY